MPTFARPVLQELLNAVLIALGILLAGMGLKGFLLSNFVDGGVTGVSMLLNKTSGVSLSILLPLVNLPFVAVGFRQMGTAFAVRSVLGISGLAFALAIVPYPDVTPDLVLTAVFGGFFSVRASVSPFAVARCWTGRRSPRCSSAAGPTS